MKTYNKENFIDIIRKDLNPLSKEDFFKTKRLGELWDKLESNDIRKTLLKNKEDLYEWCYNFIHSDKPLELYFDIEKYYGVNLIDDSNPYVQTTIAETGEVTIIKPE